jgi:hypothetical protein
MKIHILQLITFGGQPGLPLLFANPAAAEACFVKLVQENFGTSYHEFCNQEGFSEDDFSAARAFHGTLEEGDDTINYRILNKFEGKEKLFLFSLDAVEFKRQRELILELTEEAKEEKFSSSRHQVLDGLTNLLDAIADQAHDVYGMDVLLDADQCEGCEAGDAGCQKDAKGCPFQELPLEEPDAPVELTSEQYVEFIKKKFDRGPDDTWGAFPFFPKTEWQDEVAAGHTPKGYWEHVAANIMKCKEAAEDAGYTVIDCPGQEGKFIFVNLGGMISETSYDSEEEAWCDANSHIDGN